MQERALLSSIFGRRRWGHPPRLISDDASKHARSLGCFEGGAVGVGG